MNLFNRPPGIAALALAVILGLAIGGWLAVRSRNPVQPARTVARTNAAPAPLRTKAPPTVVPAAPSTLAPTAAATVAPTTAPTVAPTVAPTATPTIAATVAAASSGTANAAVQGAWQIDEANVRVGTIVWSGSAVSRGNTIALAVRKASVGGHAAGPCERQTELRAAVSVGVSAQTVPYQEVNCQGASSTGEVRVSAFAPDGRSFHGSFWLDGVKVGDFDARRR